MTTARETSPGFGVYVHWPFCLAKCPYCDFNSHVRHRPVDASSFGKALAAEIDGLAERAPERTVGSVFFGGGTPSLMPPAEVARIIERIARRWTLAADAEVTLEANPTSAEAANFAGYRAAGVNRLSVGVQALDDESLAALGRRHTVDEALEAWRLAARLFPRASFDLIYARPGQTLDGWRAELSRALAEGAGHMSLYQLTIEPGTPFAALHAAGRLELPEEELAARLYDLTDELTERAGLQAYEVSNHARPGEESRHNLLYWRYGEYVGAGPGAHSRIRDGGERLALVNEKQPETWLDLVARKGTGKVEETALTALDEAREMLLMGLRLSEGIDPSRYAGLAGESLDAERLAFLIEEGLLRTTAEGRIAATPAGRRVLDAVIATLAF
jgi:oxygen-independent coproporphyrinogen-3 oxidase